MVRIKQRQKEAEERTALLDVEKRRRAAIDEERSLISKGVFSDCETCPTMVVVRAGDFLMGSSKSEIDAGTAGDNEGPQRKIVIRQPLAVGRFEVTRDQFQAFVSSSGHRVGDECWTLEDNEPRKRADRSFLNPGYPQIGSHPAVCVSWEDANAYAEWLSKTTGKAYRLLSEAQWEFVARAGTPGRYGGAEADLCAFCQGQLSHQKIPRYFQFVASLPLTGTGKVQKFVLREQAIKALGLEDLAHIQTA